MAHLWTKTPMYSRTTGALAQAAPQLPDNRSTTLFRFSPLPSLQDTGKWEATGPPQPLARDSCVLGGCSCDWLAPRTVYCPQWEGRSGPFLYHWPERREKVMGWREEGAIAEMLEREKETEREREPVRENKQDRGCSVCQVSGEFQNVLHRCENSWRVICSWRCHLSSVRRSRATSLASAVGTRAHTSTDMQTDV